MKTTYSITSFGNSNPNFILVENYASHKEVGNYMVYNLDVLQKTANTVGVWKIKYKADVNAN